MVEVEKKMQPFMLRALYFVFVFEERELYIWWDEIKSKYKFISENNHFFISWFWKVKLNLTQILR